MTRVSDVVSIGQKLSLMCIGQDVRGNIKLSLKATLPRTGSKANQTVRESVAPTKPQATSCEEERIEEEKLDSLSKDEDLENQNNEAVSSSQSPVILIRSAAECDDGEDKPLASSKSSNSSSRNSKKLEKQRENEASTSARNLKIGMELTAKVHQIRARGLVLELDGGLRGMYRFEVC